MPKSPWLWLCSPSRACRRDVAPVYAAIPILLGPRQGASLRGGRRAGRRGYAVTTSLTEDPLEGFRQSAAQWRSAPAR